ncbi:TonB-dependent receptor domain-containing protein [Hymenobacter terrenus]|uniref:TonB-dependent receptor domain-containing protein n=1 Tax=Hymenobacter terrenus TaxID=1629124 RepID=UPI00069710BA|nr:TonB-dependent receptor [Hymenobacter terrenus]
MLALGGCHFVAAAQGTAAPTGTIGASPTAVRSGEVNITGVVQGVAGAPLEFATVLVHRAADSTVVQSGYSDAQGAFQLVLPAGGRYLVSATQVGFVQAWSAPFGLPAAGLALVLRPSIATALKEVTVLGQKPVVEQQGSNTVVNVENSTLAVGNTALDVLTRAPGVTVDGSDNLALRGKQDVLVLIDGKRQLLSGAALADYLRTLPAEQLKSIELIPNPPASADAQGGAGVIAITLKKGQRQGTNATVNVSYGRSQVDRYVTGLSLNHRQGPFNTFGSYTYADRSAVLNIREKRQLFEQSQPVGTSNETYLSTARSRSHTWKAGADYTPSVRTTVGVAVNGQALRANRQGLDALTLFDAAQASTELLAPEHRRQELPNWAGNVTLKHSFADSSNSRSLTADVNYATYRTTLRQSLTALTETRGSTPAPLLIDQASRLTLRTTQLDYFQPLTHRRQLSMGLKTSQVQSNNDLLSRKEEGNDTYVVDPAQTNNFRYDERIHAAYVAFQQAGPKATLQAGLRGEQTTTKGVQQVGSENFSRQYLQLFPTASLAYKFSARHELALSLGRRVNRPNYTDLNPFRRYVNATTYSSGNKDLQPETSYNVEITHTFLQKYSTGLSYSNTRNASLYALQPIGEGSRIAVNRPINLTTRHYAALTLAVPLTPRPGWLVYNNAVLFYTRFIGESVGTAINRGQSALNLSSTHTLALGHDWNLDLSATYESAKLMGFIRFRALGELAAGVQKSLWQRRATIKLNATDLLFTRSSRGTSTYNTYVGTFRVDRDTRAATLAFSYRLGSDKLVPTRRADSAAEEKRRTGQ